MDFFSPLGVRAKSGYGCGQSREASLVCLGLVGLGNYKDYARLILVLFISLVESRVLMERAYTRFNKRGLLLPQTLQKSPCGWLHHKLSAL